MAAIVAATLLAAGVFVACSGVPLGLGPLYVGEGASEAGGAWDAGTTISFGASKIRNPTDDPIVVREISLTPEHDNPGATVTAVYVVDLTGIKLTAGLDIGFPPANQATHTFIAAAGATLKPNTWYQVMFVVKIEKPGVWAFPSYEVRYEVGALKYKATVHDGLRLCAPKGTKCGN